ncbi:hypothetical protein PTKIN_Ptkin16aG0000600 [Pterospermum kingtungense]
MADEGHSKASCSLGVRCPLFSWREARKMAVFNDEIQGKGLYDDIVEELVINQVNFPSLQEGIKVKSQDQPGYKDIGAELVINPPNSLQEETKVKSQDLPGYKDIGVELVRNPSNSLLEAGVEPLSPKMSSTSSSCDSYYSYREDGFLPTCSFGNVIYPQFSYREEPSPLICRLVCKENKVDIVEEGTSDSLKEQGTKLKREGQPGSHEGLPKYNTLQEEEGTKIKSQGQHKNPPYSHKGLHKGSGVESVKNPLYSLQAPKIALVPIKAQKALEKKLKKMTRHEQNFLILKVFFATSFPSKAEVRGVEKIVKNMATRLALVSLREWMLNVSTYLGVKVTDSNFDEAFEEPLFKSVAQFILHTFDMEDFERFNCWDKLQTVYTKFLNEILSNLKSENPYKFVAEGKINLDGLPSLREQDVGCILESLVSVLGASDAVVGLMDFGWPYDVFFFKEGCHDRFVEMARTVLLQYVPMEEDIKMYSILGRGCTLDAIRDEAVSNIDRILELGKCDEILAQCFKDFLASMIKRRYDILKCFCYDVTNVLRHGKLGSFAKEVFELVDIAEVRRRFLSHRFISKHHIFWAVRLTEFKDFVDRLVEDIGLKCLVEKPAIRPPYSVYISAQTTADIHGDKVVGVEHIVVATIFEMSHRRLRKNLNEFNNIHCVKEFVDAVRDYKKKHNDQRHLDKVNFGNEEHLDDPSSDISLYAEDDECDVDIYPDDTVLSENEDHHSDISLNSEDEECDVDIYPDNNCLEYVNKNKIKNLRRKIYKTY